VLSHKAELVRELLELEQNYNVKLNTPDADGWTPLQWPVVQMATMMWLPL
jgi:hypothetical protein